MVTNSALIYFHTLIFTAHSHSHQ